MDSFTQSPLNSSSPFDCLLFDLDDTLYSSKLGFGEATKRNIDDFLVEKCGFPESQAKTLRVELFKTYGSTLAGLRALGYDVSADEYHSVVHGRLPYHLVKPDAQLRNLLESIKQRKIIFTNSDRVHAMKVLDRLGITECFEQIICFETMNPDLAKATRPDEFPVVLKPSLEAMKIAIEAAGIDPRRTVFLDDSVRNVAAGKIVGLRTVLHLLIQNLIFEDVTNIQLAVGRSIKSKEADYAVDSVANLMQVVPEIWYSEEDDQTRISRTRSEMDSILATTAVGA